MSPLMRTHQKIVTDFGASKLFHAIVAQGRGLAPNTPQRWAERDRIPGEWWGDVVAAGAATLEELQTSHRPRKRSPAKASQVAA